MKYWLVAASSLALLGLSGCSSSEDEQREIIANQGANALYQQAKRNMDTGNFSGAAQILSSIDSRFPFGELSHQVQLDLIYSYYKSGDTDQTLATIDRFVRLNPNHSDVDYAMYMRGLTNMERDSNLFQDLFNVDRADRDPSNSREAFEDFRKLVEKHPDSKYSGDAKKRMVSIKNRLAKYEIAVARFYMRREAWVAAANRGRYVLEYYADTTLTQPALEIMVESYDQMGLEELRNNALKTLKLNYPDSQYIR
ncbi:outer membrane protein assembly factor BamD [Agaribacter marinus]|uniref:Outer membrane protein assembly factor BamD n=1 Tax=Agaribacter marinus TaxID=1431249 RepID=A0AA37WJI5_9ALTE|nr:outer membrane protein assembly factor BamD [Agaribacter marinus]GLR73081.1 outer membrane protein assembly factor BamD [Agaribacter marinus]